MRIGCWSPRIQFTWQEIVKIVHISSLRPRSSLLRGSVHLWLCFRAEFRQKFGPDSSLKWKTGMHRTPAESHICRRCEPSLKGGGFFLYSLYVNFSYLHQYSGVICQMSCLQARHCNARICLLKTRACLLNIEHTYYHVETENVFIIFFFHNIS